MKWSDVIKCKNKSDNECTLLCPHLYFFVTSNMIEIKLEAHIKYFECSSGCCCVTKPNHCLTKIVFSPSAVIRMQDNVIFHHVINDVDMKNGFDTFDALVPFALVPWRVVAPNCGFPLLIVFDFPIFGYTFFSVPTLCSHLLFCDLYCLNHHHHLLCSLLVFVLYFCRLLAFCCHYVFRDHHDCYIKLYLDFPRLWTCSGLLTESVLLWLCWLAQKKTIRQCEITWNRDN